MGRFLHASTSWGPSGASSTADAVLQALGRFLAVPPHAGWLPSHLETAYESLVRDLLGLIEQRFDEATPYRQQRLHGDCHRRQRAVTDAGPHFVDLDDCMTGPRADLWMLLSGTPDEMSRQLGDTLDGYGQFADFDRASCCWSNRCARCA